MHSHSHHRLRVARSPVEAVHCGTAIVGLRVPLRLVCCAGGKRLEVVLAQLKGEAVGFAVFFHNFSTFLGRPGLYLEDLYIKPDFRGRGVGRWLLTFVAKIAVDRKCGRFEWSVLDWNTRALDFYRALGAVAMDEWTVQRVTGAALQRLGSHDFPNQD